MSHPHLPPSPASPPHRKAKRVVVFATPGRESVEPATVASSRLMSASEVARNIRHFETWASHQGCEQVAFSDLPEDLAADAEYVFNVSERIPTSWVEEESAFSQQIKALSPSLLEFLQGAYSSSPELFSDTITYSAPETHELFEELTTVRLAWKRLQSMRRDGEKWSEADYAANVYNLFRSTAIHRSTYRCQCSISLPQPHRRPSGEAHRVLHPKNAVPDCVTFVKASTIRHLSHSVKSPYKTLNVHPEITKHSQVLLEHSFRYQSTPCSQPPETPCFEFASSFWEDKKPAHELLEHAYRQNRMATAAAARMLYSMQIDACVFGLVWADGTVRAHVDWCTDQRGYPTVFSAPYPGAGGDSGPVFHEWSLDQPSDILRVYLLLRNIDTWTSTHFRERVVDGVESFSQAISRGGHMYMPWKRVNGPRLTVVPEGKENRFQTASGSRGRTVRQGR
ncbi:hypothetical protein JB92DRAFT_2864577 [Gautieria morchelliformis]|nr:hypothetical protein JB92DRAFT_2864577 [Gautieria morchelliformis]